MPPVAVFDTNVLFSGVAWKGKPFQCVELARAGVVEGVTCRELLDELAGKLQSKLSFTAEQTLQTTADLLTFLRVVTITGQLKAVHADPDDDKVLECAVAAGATHIVTGYRRHLLPLGSFQGIAIVSAADFLAVRAVP
ncbi:MAG: putative toxin-antitoxin system toxin component, PIN family [Planctomycetia bacterium]|nr:putative toxin-antitoxin system toxin component, PIN family [Planctomycetia bacterium]